MITGINSLRIFSVMITDWETNFTDLQANDFGNHVKNNDASAGALGRDMGGCKTYGGRKTYQRTRPPEKCWTPPKELLLSALSRIFVQEEQSTDT